MRRLLGHGRPPRAGRLRGDRVDRHQLLPGAGGRARRPGGRDVRGCRVGTPDELHPVQHEMAVRGGSQCGYCTPGLRLLDGRGVLPLRPRRHQRHRTGHDEYHGDNGFDLHAISGNLCRCTGYRPIKDAAFALGFPADDDQLAARRAPARAGAPSTRLHDGEADFVRPATSPRRWPLLADHPRGGRRRRQHRLGRRRQPQGPPGRARRRGRPAPRAARLRRHRRPRSGSAPPSP